MLLHGGHNAGILLLAGGGALSQLPGMALVTELPPLAALGIGLMGLSLALGVPGSRRLDAPPQAAS
jgi:hypothetical protein